MIIIPGRPIPYKRMTQRGKHVKASAQKYLAYKNRVGWIAKGQGIRVEKRARIGVKVYLYGSTTKFGMDGDIDNYLKAALDGLNGIAFEDDREITSVWAEKLRAEDKDSERMEIYLEEDSE